MTFSTETNSCGGRTIVAGQVWKRKGGKALYRVYSVRQGRFNLLDEAEGHGPNGQTFTRVIAEPLHGGRPIGATAEVFEERYQLQGAAA